MAPRGARAGPPAPEARSRIALVAHGTTVATNALLQRTGARTGLVTTAGFRDVLARALDPDAARAGGRRDPAGDAGGRRVRLGVRRGAARVPGVRAAGGHGAERLSRPGRRRLRPAPTPARRWPAPSWGRLAGRCPAGSRPGPTTPALRWSWRSAAPAPTPTSSTWRPWAVAGEWPEARSAPDRRGGCTRGGTARTPAKGQVVKYFSTIRRTVLALRSVASMASNRSTFALDMTLSPRSRRCSQNTCRP